MNSLLGFDLFGSSYPIASSASVFAGVRDPKQAEHDNLVKMLTASPTGAVFTQTIRWKPAPGHEYSTTCHSFYQRDARKQALRSAIRQGYTRPRWWQWWRWSEDRLNFDFS